MCMFGWKHVCPLSLLPQHCSQPQLSLSSIDPPEGPHPPLPPTLPQTPDHRWMEGFPVPLSVFQPLYLISSECCKGRYVCQASVDCLMVLASLASKQTHPAAQIWSASAQKSPEMGGRSCDSNLGNNQNNHVFIGKTFRK